MSNSLRPTVDILVAETGVLLARAELAASPAARRKGLLGRDGLEPGSGMLLRPCSSVHTWFMRFPIDVVFLDRDARVVKIVERLRAFRMAWGGWSARDTLELPAGTVKAATLTRGQRLLVE